MKLLAWWFGIFGVLYFLMGYMPLNDWEAWKVADHKLNGQIYLFLTILVIRLIDLERGQK